MKDQKKRKSKFLSLVLRHQPSAARIELDDEGWVRVDDLLAGAASVGRHISDAELREIVKTNDKQRFCFSDDGKCIRANQGHSINVDLKMEQQEPPEILYHGTATRFLGSIFADGLVKRSRQHVHLSQDEHTAIKVGSRHGKVVVLKVNARTMHDAGYKFYLSKNNVWLTDHVPVEYIQHDQK